MADEGASGGGVFRPSTLNRIASAEELDHYIKVASPSAWVVTCAALLLVVGVIAWAVLAIVPVTVETTGVLLPETQGESATVLCWVDKSTASKIAESGAQATVNGVEAHVKKTDLAPMSASEVINFLGSDFYADSIQLSDWNYPVVIAPDAELGEPTYAIYTEAGQASLVQVSIVVLETRPINIVLGSR